MEGERGEVRGGGVGGLKQKRVEKTEVCVICSIFLSNVSLYVYTSSIGMAKAALEALNGLNLFGEKGCPQSTIHVDPDAQYRNCLILNTLLPRESTSKV